MFDWKSLINNTVGKKGSTLDNYYSEDDIAETNYLRKIIDRQIAQIKLRDDQYASVIEEKKHLLKKLEEYKNILDEISAEQLENEKLKEHENYWNNKYPKQNITYSRKESDKWYDIDVRNYFQPNDFSIPSVSGKDNDEKALNALKLVRSIISYATDTSEYGYAEFWCYPYQTMKHRKGDCEDGAVLLANIMLKSGIPYWRIRLNVGEVKGGLHCYVTYCRETDNEFVVLDWCYWYKDILISKRKKHNEERDYYDISFSWNRDYSFGKITFIKDTKTLGVKVIK